MAERQTGWTKWPSSEYLTTQPPLPGWIPGPTFLRWGKTRHSHCATLPNTLCSQLLFLRCPAVDEGTGNRDETTLRARTKPSFWKISGNSPSLYRFPSKPSDFIIRAFLDCHRTLLYPISVFSSSLRCWHDWGSFGWYSCLFAWGRGDCILQTGGERWVSFF